jgi:hypothetical protein
VVAMNPGSRGSSAVGRVVRPDVDRKTAPADAGLLRQLTLMRRRRPSAAVTIVSGITTTWSRPRPRTRGRDARAAAEAAFDTRTSKARLPGSLSVGAAKRLRVLRLRLVARPKSF